MSTPQRLVSVDLLRGAVMVLMAIDHVRVYAGVPPGGPEPAVFFTRWVTHFCAPTFVFLAGASAFLSARSPRELSRLLLTRGLWLVLLELTLIHLAWTFNPAWSREQMAGVIWTIGWCMVLMALLVRLPLKVVGAIGLAIIAGHNLIPEPAGDSVPPLLSILYYGMARGTIDLGGGWSFSVLYSIVPWIGVMAAGFAFGQVLRFEPARRDRICLAVGLGAIGTFIVLRAFDLYGDPSRFEAGDGAVPTILSFLRTTKYPASLQYLLMTLGPAIALIPLLEGARGALARAICVFGRVPFFYYLLHIPLIHLLALIVSRIRSGSVNAWLFANHPMNPGPVPQGYEWSLGLLYLVFAIAIAVLYLPCRWYADLKSRRRDGWLSYL
ncbi:MAG TPA: heparan-alpha-glucosaminide N-acetyltransferase domain-containing protein [Steroidobacteraceae bacterium]|jgi:uncharacterized membrane protein|nr:heparan-alpha-glucosaminide N-acetyltransferase domain-containing protein [Steroidobacteraceae bacterium]